MKTIQILQLLTPALIGLIGTLVISMLMEHVPWIKAYYKMVADYRAACGPDPLGMRPDNKWHIRNQFPLPSPRAGLSILLCLFLMGASTIGGMLYTCMHS